MPRHDAGPSLPALSILVPTYGRPDRIRTLLERLETQTAAPGTFEVVVVDDGSEPAIDLGQRERPYPLTLLRQDNAGPAAARNTGLGSVRAPLVLILNDDAVPAPDLVEAHLAAHAELGPGVAVLGTFDFTADSLRSPFVRLLQGSDLLFAFTRLVHGEEYSWEYFWTCNISLSVEAIRRAGMFDAERFEIALCEDVELGLRLCDQGLRIVHRAECRAEHEHRLTPESYFERHFQLGRYQHRIGAKFQQPGALFPRKIFDPAGQPVDGLRHGILQLKPAAEATVEAILELESAFAETEIPEEMARDAKQAILERGQFFRFAGLWYELTGEDLRTPRAPSPAVGQGSEAPAPDPAVSIVFASFNALENTKRCVEALRRGANPRYPQEIIAVDNGSTDGSAEWLAAQPDVELIRNPANHGAPRARNQALVRARGGWIAFLDNDVFVSRSWLPRALEHGAADSSVGSIALMANRASKKQVLPYDGPREPRAIDAFADAHYASCAGESEDATLFTSLAVLVRREVIDRIGGFDEAFSPWGFEDDDLALRIRLAGWRNLVARDTFVFHAEYGSADKHQRHAAWLETNWDRFLAKWCPARRGAALFDYAGVTVPQPGEATEAQLVAPLPGPDAPPPTWEDGAREAPAPSAPAVPPATGAANLVVVGCGRAETDLAAHLFAGAGWSAGGDDRVGPVASAGAAEVDGINEALLAPLARDEAPLGPMQHRLMRAEGPLEFAVDGAMRGRMDRLCARGPFALADPRFSYTLPAWRPSLGDAKVLCVFRDPAATAAGLLEECATADHLRDVPMDFDRAVEVWQAMHRQILDEHARAGEWLFVHADELSTPEGVARVEAFAGAPLARALPERPLEPSRSHRSVPAAAAAIYDELCARAAYTPDRPIPREDAPAAVLDVDAPEMTVLVRARDGQDPLDRCLDALERQTARGRYEIVVVGDGSSDTTRAWLDARPQGAPTKVVHQPGGGLAAARNAGLRVSRGRHVLFIDDDAIAAEDLVERHLAAHAEHGPGRAILGTLEPPRALLDNALMRVLEDSRSGARDAALDPGALLDWTRLCTSNVSVTLDDVRRVSLFDETLGQRSCEDADLGLRLEKECGTRIVVDPTARARHVQVLTFDDVRDRSYAVSAAFVRLFAKHPDALRHPSWRGRAGNTLRSNEELLVGSLHPRALAEAEARELSRIDLGAIERTGAEGEALARVLAGRLAAYLLELNNLWWAEGENDGYRALGVSGMADLVHGVLPSGGASPKARIAGPSHEVV